MPSPTAYTSEAVLQPRTLLTLLSNLNHDDETAVPTDQFRAGLVGDIAKGGDGDYAVAHSSPGTGSRRVNQAFRRAGRLEASPDKVAEQVATHIANWGSGPGRESLSFSFSVLWPLFFAGTKKSWLKMNPSDGNIKDIVILWAKDPRLGLGDVSDAEDAFLHTFSFPSLGHQTGHLCPKDKNVANMACEGVALQPIRLHRWALYSEVLLRLHPRLVALLEELHYKKPYLEFEREVAAWLSVDVDALKEWGRWVRSVHRLPQPKTWSSVIDDGPLERLFGPGPTSTFCAPPTSRAFGGQNALFADAESATDVSAADDLASELSAVTLQSATSEPDDAPAASSSASTSSAEDASSESLTSVLDTVITDANRSGIRQAIRSSLQSADEGRIGKVADLLTALIKSNAALNDRLSSMETILLRLSC